MAPPRFQRPILKAQGGTVEHSSWALFTCLVRELSLAQSSAPLGREYGQVPANVRLRLSHQPHQTNMSVRSRREVGCEFRAIAGHAIEGLEDLETHHVTPPSALERHETLLPSSSSHSPPPRPPSCLTHSQRAWHSPRNRAMECPVWWPQSQGQITNHGPR